MTKITKILRILKYSIFLFAILFTLSTTAQVGIGTTSPASGALLDLTSSDRGLLIPRITIPILANAAPVTAPAIGLLVWNLDVGTGVGFHYWDGAWFPLGGSATANDWTLAGNVITGTEILGTLSNHHLNIRSNSLDRMRVEDDGQVTVGYGAALNPNPTFMLTTFGAVAGNTAVGGFSFDGGTAVFAQETGYGFGVNSSVWDGAFYGTGTAVSGINNGGSDFSGFGGVGVYAENFYSNNYSVHAVDGTTSVYGANTFGGIGVSGTHFGDGVTSAGGIGVRAENFFGNNYSLYALDGFYSVYGDNNIGGDAVRGDTNSTISNGVWATNPNAAGTAIIGGANGLSIFRTGGSGVAGSGNTVGVFGYAGLGAIANANQGNAAGVFDLDTDADPTTNDVNGTKASAMLAGFDNVQPFGTANSRNSYFGGYFDAGYRNITPPATIANPTYAYVGMRYRTGANGTSAGTTTDYKIIGTGTVSTLIKDENNIPRVLFAPEAPEILFEDYGTGKLINGQAEIAIDPILKDAIFVDSSHPLKVFIQLEGDCNGVYVTNKSANGFTVKELQNGNSNVPFSWHIVANRADTKDASGMVTSKHVGLRLPIGPGPIKPKEAASRKEEVDLNNIPVNQKALSKVMPEKLGKPEKQEAQSKGEDEDKKYASKKIETKNLKKK